MARVRLSMSPLKPPDLREVELAGPSSGNRALGSVDLLLAPSDVKANAELALKNLVEESTRGGKLSADEITEKVDELAEAGQSAIQSNLFKSFQSAVPKIDNVIQLLDRVADVRVFISLERPLLTAFQAHPYLKLTWQLTTVLYRVGFTFDRMYAAYSCRIGRLRLPRIKSKLTNRCWVSYPTWPELSNTLVMLRKWKLDFDPWMPTSTSF